MSGTASEAGGHKSSTQVHVVVDTARSPIKMIPDLLFAQGKLLRCRHLVLPPPALSELLSSLEKDSMAALDPAKDIRVLREPSVYLVCRLLLEKKKKNNY